MLCYIVFEFVFPIVLFYYLRLGTCLINVEFQRETIVYFLKQGRQLYIFWNKGDNCIFSETREAIAYILKQETVVHFLKQGIKLYIFWNKGDNCTFSETRETIAYFLKQDTVVHFSETRETIVHLRLLYPLLEEPRKWEGIWDRLEKRKTWGEIKRAT